LLDYETLQKTKIFGEQTAAARIDVIAKKLLADGPKTGLLAARAISTSDPYFTEHFAAALVSEPQGYRHILNIIIS